MRYARESPTWPNATWSSSTSATVMVVPMPDVLGSLLERSYTRRFASWIRSEIRCSPPSFAWASLSAAVASRDATSPATAPPIPSAIAKSGGWMTYESSLCRRVRPGSVTAPVRPIMRTTPVLSVGGTSRFPQTPSTGPLRGRTLRVSLLVPQVGLADANDVPLREPAGMLEARPVQVRAVRRAEVLDPDAVLTRLEASMPRRRELVRTDRDVVLSSAADRQLRRVELEILALIEVGALDDHEPPGDGAAARRLDPRLAGRSEDEALLRQAQIAARGADDAPDKEVKQNEERDLEDEQDFVDRGRVEEHWLLRFPGERHVRRPERDRVAAAQLRTLDPLSVDLDPVRRAEVHDPVGRALLP